jgi:RHS repeat-associated protein
VRVSNSWTGHSSTALVEQHSEQFEHDHRGRLWRVRSGGVVLAEHRYNELGQRSETNYYSTDTRDYRQSVDFTYHPMGWLQRVNRIDGNEAGRVGTSADFFALELGYEGADPAPLPGGFAAPARHDGRISWLRWRDPNSGPGIIGWHFRYDGLGRLTDARSVRHAVGAGGALINMSEAGHVAEQASYDREGNITRLSRYHLGGLVDDLIFRYDLGRLVNVRDQATQRLPDQTDFFEGASTDVNVDEFLYDAAGNVRLDFNRNFTAEYNRLNRVTRLIGPGGTNAHESFFAYDGLGRLRSERTLNPVENPQSGQQRSERVRYFAQGLTLRADVTLAYQSATNEWAQVASTIVIDRVDGSAGYWSSGKWHFSITDQVGTPRVIFDQNGQVVERNHYYPYGVRYSAWSSAPTGSPEEEGFAGGERVANELAVTWQRNGARLYDAVLGRFLGVEPLADRLVNESVYLYSGGDPVNYSDPDGRRKRKKKEEATNERVDENEESVDEHAEQDDGGVFIVAWLYNLGMSLLKSLEDSEDDFASYGMNGGSFSLAVSAKVSATRDGENITALHFAFTSQLSDPDRLLNNSVEKGQAIASHMSNSFASAMAQNVDNIKVTGSMTFTHINHGFKGKYGFVLKSDQWMQDNTPAEYKTGSGSTTGLGALGSPYIYINYSYALAATVGRTMLHEIGHNIGLNHLYEFDNKKGKWYKDSLYGDLPGRRSHPIWDDPDDNFMYGSVEEYHSNNYPGIDYAQKYSAGLTKINRWQLQQLLLKFAPHIKLR